MKVKTLIKKLSKLNPAAEVLISSDSEGNSFSILDSYDDTEGLKYQYGEFGREIDIVTKLDIDEYFTEKDYNKYKDCIVLYPR